MSKQVHLDLRIGPLAKLFWNGYIGRLNHTCIQNALTNTK